MPDSIPLDDPTDTEPEGELEFPPIPPQTWQDPYNNVTIRVEAFEDDAPKLVLTQGDPNTDDVFARYRLDLPEAFLFALADNLIEPLRQYRALEKDDNAARMAREAAETQAKQDACAFRAADVGLVRSHDYKLIVHRRDCRHALDANPRKARMGTGTHAQGVYREDLPLTDGTRLRELLKDARTRLELCADVQHVAANADRVAAAMNQQRVRDTALNQKPLQFCGTCKPLGRNTSALMTRAFDLANMTVFRDTATQDIHALFAEIETALWETEQEHLTALQGNGNEDSA